MATSMPNLQDQQGGAPPAGGAPSPASAPSQGQATNIQMLLANWAKVARDMAAAEPRIAAGMNKVAQGIQEAQTALVTPPQPTPMSQQPQ